MKVKELIEELSNLSSEDKEKEIGLVSEENVGVYLCIREGQNKVKPVIEVQTYES